MRQVLLLVWVKAFERCSRSKIFKPRDLLVRHCMASTHVLRWYEMAHPNIVAA
jgi:hypothetical protein